MLGSLQRPLLWAVGGPMLANLGAELVGGQETLRGRADLALVRLAQSGFVEPVRVVAAFLRCR